MVLLNNPGTNSVDRDIFERKRTNNEAELLNSAKYSNKLVFLGISGDKYAISRQTVSSGGLYLNIKGKTKQNKILINPGIGLLHAVESLKLNMMDFDIVLALSNTLKRAGELNTVLAMTSYFGEDKKVTLVATDSVVNNAISEEAKAWQRLHHAAPDKIINFDDFKMSFFPTYDSYTKMLRDNNLGFSIVTRDYRLCFAGDTDYSKKLLKYYDCDILLLNVIDYQADKEEPGLSVEDAIALLKEVKPKACIIMGYSYRLLKRDPLSIARKIYMESKVTCIAAKDGLVITPTDYAKSSQRSLLGL